MTAPSGEGLWPKNKVCAYCGPRFHARVAFIEGEWRCIDRDDCKTSREAQGIKPWSSLKFDTRGNG